MFRYIFALLRSFRCAVSSMVWLAFFYATVLSLNPYLIKTLINTITSEKSILWPSLAYLTLHGLLVISFRVHSYFVEIKMIPTMRRQISGDAMDHLFARSYRDIRSDLEGRYGHKVTDLMHSIPEGIQLVIDQFLGLFFIVIISTFTLWTINAFFAYFMMGWIAIFLCVAFFFSSVFIKRADAWSDWNTKLSGIVVDIFSNILPVTLFSMKNQEKETIKKTAHSYGKLEQNLQWAYFWMWLYFGLSTLFLQSCNFYLLAKGYREKWITAGDFALVLSLSMSISNHMWRIAKDFSSFTILFGKAQQAYNFIFQPQPSCEEPLDLLTVDRGAISFENVRFSYKNEELFYDKSITIQGGEKVGLIGYSGSGKSTFAHLILNLYPITQGRICIDGQDIRDVSINSLRAQVAMIPQDPTLFQRTILENLCYGKPDASLEAVKEACRQVHADSFIEKMGYDAQINAINLSGGQKQRILMVRALLHNTPILILDEAMNQVDSLTESMIWDNLNSWLLGKTVLIIAHRLSTLLSMDRILVFDQGKIVQDGPHSQLIQEEGLYKRMWERQNL